LSTLIGKKNVLNLASLHNLGHVAAERALAKTLKEQNKKKNKN
jgi:hypothetical protein